MTTKNKNEGAVTPFAFHKVVNEHLEKAGLTMIDKTTGATVTKRIPPQMMYNYTLGRINKGKEPFIKVTESGLIELEDGMVWLQGYIQRLLSK